MTVIEIPELIFRRLYELLTGDEWPGHDVAEARLRQMLDELP